MQFWGADSMCNSLYVGALQAAIAIGNALNDSTGLYSELLLKAVERMETRLFNGAYFIQETAWKHLRTPFSPYDISWPRCTAIPKTGKHSFNERALQGSMDPGAFLTG